MKKSWMISRRTFLRGAGAMIGLPALEAMYPAMAHAQGMGASPRRILAWYIPCGIHMAHWTPSTTGAGYAPTRILQPLFDAGVSGDVNILTGLANRPARPDGPGDHASGTGAFLTAAHPFKTEGENIMNGISMDQVAANAIGSATPFASLQLGSDGGGSTGDCDSGYSCAYARNISWAGPSTPLAKDTNPGVVFDRLFAGRDPLATAEQQRKRKLYKKSILDFVQDDAERLKAKLGRTDQRKMDEYLTGVRELETRLDMTNEGPVCAGDRPDDSTDFVDRVNNMVDVMVLAMKCDLTRVISFMMGNAGSNRAYGFIGVPEQHHELSHHQDNPVNFEKLTLIDTWEVSMFASLLAKMKAVVEPDGTLLDNSAVFFSSEIEDGNSHSHFNMPIILAGRGGGTINTGRHVRYNGEPPVANLFVSMLSTVGVSVPSFGDSTGPLGNLT